MADEWDVTKPIDHTKIGDLPGEHRKITAKVETVLEKEHRTLGDGNSGGEHKKGSAQCYSDDYSGGLPQLRPDGATAIDANDEGRLAYDENDGRLMMQDGGSAGDDTDYTQVGGEVLDEDDLTSDSATKLATQQSIKAFASAYIKLVDSKATTTDGGTFTTGDWRKRTVTEETDVGSHCAVSSSVIVLDAGTYECRISCPALQVNQHQARLRNTTGNTTILVGTAEDAGAASSTSNRSFIVGRFTIAAAQNLEIQHKCAGTKATTGFGLASDQGEAEIYTIAEFWKR